MTATTEPWLILDETEGVEVLGALELATKVYDACGDNVMMAHYRDLNIAIKDRARNAYMNPVEPVHPLVAAFHALWDVKDNASRAHREFTDCYKAIEALKVVMMNEDVEIPKRYDTPRNAETGEPV